MNFLDARAKILKALDAATNVANDAQFGGGLDNPDIDLPFDRLKLDSLAVIECCMLLEEDTRVEIDPADLATHGSVNRLAEYIARRTAGT